jgi:DNA-binding beta-propeller fold protein YncE
MTARRLASTTIASLCVLISGLAFASTSALATRGHVLGYSFGGAGNGDGEFEGPAGVAVNELTGNVYVVDQGNDRVEEFDSTGNYLSQFAGGAAPSGALSSPTGIAIDNSTESLVDPSAGDVYVVDQGHQVIDKFSSEGVYLGQLQDGAGGVPFGELEGVAVDPSGVVWVYQASGEIDSFSDALANEFLASRTSQAAGVPYPGFAVDSEGHLYVVSHIRETVAKLNRSGELIQEEIGELVGATGLAANRSTDEVFVADTESVAELESDGQLKEAFGVESTDGIAVDAASASESVYVADPATDEIDVFVLQPMSAPTISDESVASVGAESATFGGEIDPNGVDTHYYFQYGSVSCTTSPSGCEDAPSPPGLDLGSEFGIQAIGHVHPQGLQPNTTYHYRLVAYSSFGGGSGSTVYGPEETFTTGAAQSSSSLSDDRAYELVSPPDKNGGEVEAVFSQPPLEGLGGIGGLQSIDPIVEAAPNGEAVVYGSKTAFGAEPQSSPLDIEYLARRGTSGWTSQSLNVPQDPTPTSADSLLFRQEEGFSPDLSHEFLQAHDPLQAPGAVLHYQNLYERDTANGELSALTTVTPPNRTPGGGGDSFRGEYIGESTDGSHVFYQANDALVSDVSDIEGADSNNYNIYELAAGKLNLVNVLPDGDASPDASLGSELDDTSVETHNAISADGSRVYWTDDQSEALYLRSYGVSTVAVSKGDKATFWGASGDGSEALFASCSQLTSDSTSTCESSLSGAQIEGELYAYEAGHDRLSDLTVDPTDPYGAQVEGQVGASDDGSYVYFVALGDLAAGAVRGQPNLYVWHREEISQDGTIRGAIHYIARLAPLETTSFDPDGSDDNEEVVRRTAEVTPDGRHMAFVSTERLTGYNNTPVEPTLCEVNNVSGPCSEVFEYDAPSETLVCASCNPSGARPSGPSLIPGAENARYQQHVLSDDGSRVFFDSLDALDSRDVNGEVDVYEYEGGHDYLISGGISDNRSTFLDADANGDNVFFVTSQQLVPEDEDGAADVYDARVGGGFGDGVAQLTCTGTGCQGVPSPPPVFATPSSVTFNGLGNFVAQSPARKGKAKKRVEPKHKAKHKAKKKAGLKRKAKRNDRKRGHAKKTTKGRR